MNISKRVRDGSIVKMRKFKWCLVGKGKPGGVMGVYQSARKSKIFTDEGLIEVSTPRGVIVSGFAQCKVGAKK